ELQAKLEYNSFRLGSLNYIDSAEFYERYITIDDNQYPYRRERYDHFSVAQNCKTMAFIVPLYRHILLSAEVAVKIIEKTLTDMTDRVSATLSFLHEYDSQINPLDSPLVLRYYLSTSRNFVDFRNRSTDYLEEKAFYSAGQFPKFVWVGEVSTPALYEAGMIFGEIVVDATAPTDAGFGAVISVRLGSEAASRAVDESPDTIKNVFNQQVHKLWGPIVFKQYSSNLKKGDF
ncbi:MAG: hypothetical protein ACSW8F_06735, partial [bacterium]